VAAAALLVSCATAREATKQEALVCPQCKVVEVRSAAWQGGFSSRRGGGGGGPRKIYEHRCEGCQGVLMTFFREGKFQHKCSFCKETPFTCPVIHPDTARP
jgi:phage FluMu protein Com